MRSPRDWATRRMPRPKPRATSCARAPSSTRSMPTSRRRARSSRSTTCGSRPCAVRPKRPRPHWPRCAPVSSVSRLALDAALARRAEAEADLAGVDPDLVPEGSAAEYAAAYERAQRDATDAEAAVARLRERLHAAERESRIAHGADHGARPSPGRAQRRRGARRARRFRHPWSARRRGQGDAGLRGGDRRGARSAGRGRARRDARGRFRGGPHGAGRRPGGRRHRDRRVECEDPEFPEAGRRRSRP